MSVETLGKIKGRISQYDILNYIKQTIDPNAEMSVSPTNYGDIEAFDFIKENYDDTNKWIITSGFMHFTTKEGNHRSLFYFYDNTNSYENLEYYENYGLVDMVKSETTSLHLGCNDEAVEIITDIVAQFGGGWIDENDCDSEEYYSVPAKNEKTKIKPVIRVTMEEIYEKFGGIVIIEDYRR